MPERPAASSAANEVFIRSMTMQDVTSVVALADRLIGVNYYPPRLVQEMIQRSTTAEAALSFIATSASGPVGFRFTLPPGGWYEGRGAGLTPHLWPAPLEQTGYFQSAFVDPAWRGRGVGASMAARAIDALRRVGARAVVAHSWKESPGGASFRYLSSLGFRPVAEFPLYWSEVDYVCARDGHPCLCTAIEMVLDLSVAGEG